MKKNLIGIAIMLVAAVFTAIGQMYWKIGLSFSDDFLKILASTEVLSKVLPYILVGFALYACGTLLMIIAYKYGDVSLLHPLLGVSYILSLIIGFFVLGEESFNLQKIIAVIVIITGLAFLGWSAYDIEKRRKVSGGEGSKTAQIDEGTKS